MITNKPVALVLASIFADTLTSGAGLPLLAQRFQTFVTILSSDY